MILQLNPQIPVRIEDPSNTYLDGKIGQCVGWIDYSEEYDLMWVVALDDNGEVWTLPNSKIRLIKNYSIGRK